MAANQEPLQWQETGGLNQGYVHSTSCRDSLETSALFCRNKAHGILRHYWLHLFFIHLYRDLSSPLPLAKLCGGVASGAGLVPWNLAD